MRNTKKNMILIVLSVSIIVCVGIIMAIVAQSKASAATDLTCPTHGSSFLKYTQNNDGSTHQVVCQSCGSNLGTEQCLNYKKWYVYSTNPSAGHRKQCSRCSRGWASEGVEGHSGGTHANGGKCTTCYYQYQTHSKKNATYERLNDLQHSITYTCSYTGCNGTYTGETEAHSYVNGVCVCGATQSGGSTTCSHSNVTATNVNKDYHKVTCRDCGYVIKEMETHTWNSSGKCSACGTTCSHTWNSSGKCTTCGITCSHTSVKAVAISNDNTYHNSVCKNCGITVKKEEHVGGRHENGGKCTLCSYQYMNHNKGTSIVGYDKTATTHTAKYACTYSGCTQSYEGTAEAHNYVNGTCVCGATQSQQTCMNHQITTGTDNGNGTHTGTCPNCNKQITESHNYVNGTCTKCGATQSGGGTGCIDGGPHNVTAGLPNYDGTHTGTCTKCGQEATVNCNLYSDFINKTATTHTEVIKCSGCYYEDRKTAEAHTGGTHSNGGKCTLCDYQYQNHSKGTKIAGYDKTATTHTAKYACTETGCTQNYTGTAEAHTGGTHSNGGKCTVCDYQYQNHSKGTTIVGYDKTATTHTAKYACTETGCTQSYEGTAEAHNYVNGTCVCGATQSQQTCTNHQITTGTDNGDGTHTGTCPNCNKQITEVHNFVNGTCTKCGARQSQQTCTNHQITTGTDNGNGTHTGICPNCNKQITESHNFVNGTCTKCGATQGGSETCEHDFEMKYNDTMHWEQCKKCNEVKNNKKHTFVNGKCSVCEYECKHTNTTAKKDNTYHWTECNDCGKELNKEKHSYTNGKCSCGKTEETAECTHANKEWKYNTNQHWQECKDCGAEIEGTKAAHSYTNGKCKCGKVSAAGEEEGCTHTNREWKSDTTEHWQVCKDCGKEIDGTRAKHVNVDGKCKNCGLQEGSKSGTKIPNTGYKAVAITLPIVLILVTFGAIKMKKYKEI